MGAMTVDEFLRAHRISRSLFYRLCREGQGPALMHVGSRTMISDEAAAAWRREREDEARARGPEGRGPCKSQAAA